MEIGDIYNTKTGKQTGSLLKTNRSEFTHLNEAIVFYCDSFKRRQAPRNLLTKFKDSKSGNNYILLLSNTGAFSLYSIVEHFVDAHPKRRAIKTIQTGFDLFLSCF